MIMRTLRAALLLTLVPVMLGTASAGAQSLPLEPPAGAGELVADFVAVCSRAITDTVAAAGEASGREWNDETDGVQAALMGQFTFRKRVDGGDVILSFFRGDYPHLTAMSCQLVVPGVDEMPDPEPIGSIDGVEGRVMTIDEGRLGLWSLRDEAGEIITITATATPQFTTLMMSRAVRTALGRGEGAN